MVFSQFVTHHLPELFADPSNVWVHRGWAAGVAVGTAALLIGGRYGMVERVSTVMVVLFTLSNVVAVLLLHSTAFRLTGANLAEGLTFPIAFDFGPDGALYVAAPALGATPGTATIVRLDVTDAGGAVASPVTEAPVCLASPVA